MIAAIFTDLLSGRPDGKKSQLADCCDRGTVATGRQFGELPGLTSVVGICGDGGSLLGILIVAADREDICSVAASDGKDSRGCFAVRQRRFRDAPGTA